MITIQYDPAEWQLVPVEPTVEMMDEAFDNISMSDAHTTYGVTEHVWAHMLSKAPAAPAQQDDEVMCPGCDDTMPANREECQACEDFAKAAASNKPAPAQPVPDTSEIERDAARYQWLTGDHSDHATRTKCREILSRMGVSSHSATSANIDAAMKGDQS